VALAAAYVIALASLLASFGAAHAAADTAAVPGGVICHTLAGEQAPSPSTDNGKTCVDNCCIGCLMLLAALPPPPAKIIGALQSAGQVLVLPAIAVVIAAPLDTSHRSRAPPLNA
jgi:hypothetical protein